MPQPGSGLDVTSILGRIKTSVLGNPAAPDHQLSDAIGVPRPTIASWRKRNSIPIDKLLSISQSRKIDIEWMLYGIDNKSHLTAPDRSRIDPDILEIALYDYKKDMEKMKNAVRIPYWESGKTIVLYYRSTLDLVSGASRDLGIRPEDVIATLRLERGMGAPNVSPKLAASDIADKNAT